MVALFISHSSEDHGAAERLRGRLAAAGFACIFLDFDPAQGIPVGRVWESELYSQLRKADGVIFLASSAAVSSRWCFAEVCLARSLGRPVFPIRLAPGVVLSVLNNVQWLDMSDGDSGLSQLLVGLRAAGLDPTRSFDWDSSRSPYPGLAPFGADDAAVFFGRAAETDRLMTLLQPTLERGPGRFVAILGPSGSGKS